jgi:hypothetical protein
MQDEISRMPADDEERAEKGILSLLLASDSQRPWSIAELERERGEHLGTVDAVASLHAAGLIHRCGEFVSRPAPPCVWTTFRSDGGSLGCAGSFGIDPPGSRGDPAHRQGVRLASGHAAAIERFGSQAQSRWPFSAAHGHIPV